MKRLGCRLRYWWFGMVAEFWHVQAERAHEARALKQAQACTRLSLRAVARQAAALKGLA